MGPCLNTKCNENIEILVTWGHEVGLVNLNRKYCSPTKIVACLAKIINSMSSILSPPILLSEIVAFCSIITFFYDLVYLIDHMSINCIASLIDEHPEEDSGNSEED